MAVTREYLEEQLAHLTKQAEQAFATLHSANGAIAAVKHMLSVLDAEASAQPATAEDEVLPSEPQS
jgi:hypothetical protein